MSNMWHLLPMLLLLLLSTQASSETRAAFVVGNSTYENAPILANPARDARLVADTLRRLDFEVTQHQDLTRDGFADALSTFLGKHRDADVTFFYFAGHGMQYDGKNYLVGTDAELLTEFDVEGETIALDKVVEVLERNSKATLIFVDACRDNPLASNFYRRNFSETRALATRGLARVASGMDGSMLVFAAAPGQVAYDGEGSNSPFAKALSKHLPTANTEVLSLTKRIINDVRQATEGRQSPIVINDLTQEIFLREAALPAVGISDHSEGDVEQVKQEKAFRAASRLGTIRGWIRYLDRYPGGDLQAEALSKLEEVVAFEYGAVTQLEGSDARGREAAADLEAILGVSQFERAAVQALLTGRGYAVGEFDGVFGARSRSALRAFQRNAGLPETGLLSPMTMGRLGIEWKFDLAARVASTSSFLARFTSPLAAVSASEDPRVIHAFEAIMSDQTVYGEFDGRIYVAVVIHRTGSRTGTIKKEEAAYMAQAMGGTLAQADSEAERSFISSLTKFDPRFRRARSGSVEPLLRTSSPVAQSVSYVVEIE